MAKVDLEGVHKVTSKGKVYFYAWRGRGAPRLPGDPGSAEFLDALASARAKSHVGDKALIGGLIIDYKRSPEWTGLSDKTRENWAPWLDKIDTKFGRTRIAAFDRPAIRVAIKQWRDNWARYARTADVALQVLSRLLSFALENGRLGTNPCVGIPRLYRNDRAMVIWSADDLANLAKAASEEIAWAAQLAVLTGLRQSDLLRLSWAHVKENSIEIPTGKSKGRRTAIVPLYGELRALLKRIPRRATTVLTNTEKLPWRSGFGSSWNKACTRAGIDKHFHDLRGTAATALFRAGFSPREIAESMAWSEASVEAILNVYVKRDEVLLDRIRRLDENGPATQVVKPA